MFIECGRTRNDTAVIIVFVSRVGFCGIARAFVRTAT